MNDALIEARHEKNQTEICFDNPLNTKLKHLLHYSCTQESSEKQLDSYQYPIISKEGKKKDYSC